MVAERRKASHENTEAYIKLNLRIQKALDSVTNEGTLLLELFLQSEAAAIRFPTNPSDVIH